MLDDAKNFMRKQLTRIGLMDDEEAAARHDPMDKFSFHTAKWMCKFSWESYYLPPGMASSLFATHMIPYHASRIVHLFPSGCLHQM
jgi:hypothetical protein